MTNIEIGGLTGPQTVVASAASGSDSDTGAISSQAYPSGNACYILNDPQDRRGHVISYTTSDHENAFTGGFAPGIRYRQLLVKSTDGNKVIDTASEMSGSATFLPGMFINSDYELRRIVNVEMVRVGKGKITDCKFASRLASPSGVPTKAFSSNYRTFAPNWIDNQPYWASVMAVSATGELGYESDPVQFMFTKSGGTTNEPTIITTATQTPPTNTASTLPAPGNLNIDIIGDGTVSMTWDAVPDAVGYIMYFYYNDPATFPADRDNGYYTLDIAEGGLPAAGDLMLIKTPIFSLNASMFAGRSAGQGGELTALAPGMFQKGRLNRAVDPCGYEIKTFGSGDAKPNAALGNYYGRRYIKAGNILTDGSSWASGSGNNYTYHYSKAGDDFVFEAWVRASRPITASVNNGLSPKPSQEISITTSWQKVTLHFTNTAEDDTGKVVRSWEFIVDPGASDVYIDLAGLRVYMANEKYGGSYAVIPPYLMSAMRNGQYLRDHNTVKTYPKSYDSRHMCAPPESGYRGRWSHAALIDNCNAHGLYPWFQIECGWFKEDWQAWLAWLATTYPALAKAKFEVGNESWNPLKGFWNVPPMVDSVTGAAVVQSRVWGKQLKMIWGWLKESPHWAWASTRLEHVIGGWNNNTYGESAWLEFTEAKYVTIANYNGGWDVDSKLPKDEGKYWRSMLAFQGGYKNMAKRVDALAIAADSVGKSINQDVFYDIYEAGPGYQLDGLNGSSLTNEEIVAQECVKKSRASATSQVDAICMAWELGLTSNFFTLGHSDGWKSHQRYGTEFLTSRVSQVITDFIGDDFSIQRLHSFGASTTDDVEDVGIWAFKSNATSGKWLIVALNRLVNLSQLATTDDDYAAGVTNAKLITILTPFRSATSVSVYTTGLGNFREHDRFTPGLRRGPSSGLEDVADPLCVAMPNNWQTVAAPGNLSRIVIDDTFFAGADGIGGGNFIFIALEGVETVLSEP